jgi:endonuclease/exonuclease/phosphatase family metal-dependent hydrolase
VFGVEFVELPRTGGAGGRIETACEHGNAILARYPIGNVRWGIHEANDDWYEPEDVGGEGEPRFGGRSWVQADLDLGEGLLRAISIHYESRIAANAIQVAQGEETADLAAASPIPVLVGGDTNAPLYTGDVFDGTTSAPLDQTIAALVDVGLVDAHAPLPPEERPTRSGLVIDLLLGRDVTFSNPGVCLGAVCDDLSDHRAVWATVSPAP